MVSGAGEAVVMADGCHDSAAHLQASHMRLALGKQLRLGNRLKMRHDTSGEVETKNDQEGTRADF